MRQGLAGTDAAYPPVGLCDAARLSPAVEAYLQANFRRDLPTRALADQAGLSARTFVRHFKAATGSLPGAYLQALRIEAAKAMLERDARPIQTISCDIGYDDVAFFRSLFKRLTGMTPAEYRAHFAPMSVRGQRMPEAPPYVAGTA